MTELRRPASSTDPAPGFFITFEGIDGCGKTTQLELLGERLAASGREVVRTREPGGSELGNTIRAWLLETALAPCSAAETLLFMADRSQHVAEVIRPALARGAVVLCDRHTDSTLAYQGYGRGEDIAALRRLNAYATAGLVPRLTLILDLDPETAADRMAAAGRAADRFEREAGDFHRRLRAGYLAIAAAEPERCRVIDAGRPADAVAAEIRAVVTAATGAP